MGTPQDVGVLWSVGFPLGVREHPRELESSWGTPRCWVPSEGLGHPRVLGSLWGSGGTPVSGTPPGCWSQPWGCGATPWYGPSWGSRDTLGHLGATTWVWTTPGGLGPPWHMGGPQDLGTSQGVGVTSGSWDHPWASWATLGTWGHHRMWGDLGGLGLPWGFGATPKCGVTQGLGGLGHRGGWGHCGGLGHPEDGVTPAVPPRRPRQHRDPPSSLGKGKGIPSALIGCSQQDSLRSDWLRPAAAGLPVLIGHGQKWIPCALIGHSPQPVGLPVF